MGICIKIMDNIEAGIHLVSMLNITFVSPPLSDLNYIYCNGLVILLAAVYYFYSLLLIVIVYFNGCFVKQMFRFNVLKFSNILKLFLKFEIYNFILVVNANFQITEMIRMLIARDDCMGRLYSIQTTFERA